MKLGARHARVLELLADGWTYNEIARMFDVNVEQVKRIEQEALRGER